jgi:hypothetical protein
MNDKPASESPEVVTSKGIGPSALLGSVLPLPWKNITSYSQRDTDRTPKTWEASFGKLRVCVTRHIDYPPDVWLLRCHGLGIERRLASPKIEEAACQARAIVQSHLEQMLRDVISA